MGDRDRSPRRNDRRGGAERKTKKGPPERRIFVSNLPFEMKWQEVKDLFRKEVGEVSYVELFDDESGKPRGAGVMEFNTADMAKKAIDKMHRFDYKGRKIVVKEDFDAERDKHGRIIGRNRGGGGGDGGGRGGDRNRGDNMSGGGGGGGGQGYGTTFGLSPQFLESLNISGPLHTRIFVANMDYKVDERKLKEVFRLAGKVVGIELSRDKEGKSRGFATVVYDHPVEAVQAISMFHNQQLFDRKMSVRFDKVPEEEPPRNLNRLPEGLSSVGMGLGQDGMPLLDVRANLPSSTEMGNIGMGGGNMGANMGGGGNNMSGGGNQGNNAANVGTAALQAALATIMGMGALSGNSGGNNMGGGGMGGNMGGGMGDSGNNMGSSGGMGMMNNSGGSSGGMGGMDRSMSMDRGMGGGMDRGMGGSMDRMGGGMDRGMGDSMGMGMSSSGMGGQSNSMGGGGFGSSNQSGGMFGGGSSGVRRSDSIMVRNLAMDCNWHTLKDRFSHAGDIKYAEMKERGVGIIRLDTRTYACTLPIALLCEVG